LTAEISSSFLTWSGTPTDWLGEPLHFWTFELWRLKSWLMFFAAGIALFLLSWSAVHRQLHNREIWLLGGAYAVAIEVLTTIRYWRQLSWTESAFLGISYFRRYLLEHLITWAVTLLFVFAILRFWERQVRTVLRSKSVG
jgi:hypothetical protein